LFGYIKGEMAGFTADSPADVLSEIRQIFEEISKGSLTAVYDKWIARLEWITERKGEYYHTE
jgi:hypothetical protein